MQENIDYSSPDDGLGDKLRNAFIKVQNNFTELYNGKVDKVTGKGLSENDFTDADKAKLDGIEAGAQVNVQADAAETDPLSPSYILNFPPSLYSAFGYFHYADLDTQTTPLNFVASTPLQLINDILGVFTNEDQAPYGISSVWDKPTDSLDFSQLSVGDAVLFRADLSISTTSVNQNLQLYIKFGIGTPSEYDLLIDSWNEKSAVSFKHFIKDVSFSIDNTDWRDAPAKIYLLSDEDGEVKVNGWYIPIIRKSLNIIDFNSDPTKVDKVSTAGVERAYIINADGSQGTKATSEFGGTQNLQQVTDVGNTTTNGIEVYDNNITAFDLANNKDLFVSANSITQNDVTYFASINFRTRTQSTEFYLEDEGGEKSIATREWVELNKFTLSDLQRYSLYAWRPNPTGWYGFTTPATVGTADNQSPVFSGNDFIKAFRRRYVSASTVGSSVEFYEGSFRQTSVGDGFFFSMKFGNEDVASVADARLFAGLIGDLAVFGNVNPSSKGNIIGVGADSGDANLSFMHNDSAGTAVKVSLGASFPANTIATDLYCFQMYNVPGASSVWYRLINISTKVETAWTEVTTELPATNQILLPKCWRNNGTTALAVRLSLVDLTLYKRI